MLWYIYLHTQLSSFGEQAKPRMEWLYNIVDITVNFSVT